MTAAAEAVLLERINMLIEKSVVPTGSATYGRQKRRCVLRANRSHVFLGSYS